MSPGELGVSVAANEPFAVIMDMAYPNAFVSLMSASSGDASIYISTGGGVIGGIGQAKVKQAAAAFVREAGKYAGRMSVATEYPYPPTSSVRFYLRTPEAVLMAEATEAALGSGKDPLSPLFFAAQNVITQLRLTVEGHK
jgi:hypothetical protein